MPVYQYEGQHYDLPEGLTKEQAIAKIEAHLGKTTTAPAKTEAPSGFAQGFTDPLYAASQLVGKVLEQAPEGMTVMGRPVAASARAFSEKVVPQREQQYQAQRAAAGQDGLDVGRIAGNIVNPATLVGGLRAAPAVAGAIQGALQPVTEGDFATEKLKQAAMGAAGGKVGEKVAEGVGRVLNPLASKAEQTMRELGITPTPGQTLGGAWKKAEDFAQNLPLVGEKIRSAREKVLFDFNQGVINKALSKVDEKLPEKVIGRDAVAYAAEQVSNKYDEVLNKMQFNLDFKTTSGILEALNKANLPSVAQKEKAVNILNNVALKRFDKTTLSGPEYKAIESDLRAQVSKYTNSPTAEERDIGEALRGVLNTFKDELYQQNPKMTSQLRRIDSAYGDLAVMKRAAANTGADNGVFTPKQYSLAVKQADVSRQKSNFAQGKARGQDVSEAALKTIGEDAKSTLEGRLALTSLGGMAALTHPAVAAPVGLTAAGMYSPTGVKITDALLRQRPDLVRQLGGQLQGVAPQLGGLFGAPLASELNR